jgi:hypothetical protein
MSDVGDAHVVLPGFQAITIDIAQCRRDLDAFDALLASRDELGERRDLLPFFRDHPQLSLFLGAYAVNLDGYDRLAYEYDLFGLFMADVVVGDWTRKSYCFVELEDATSRSIFEPPGQRRTTLWGSRFERGYSQVVDWYWALDSQRDTQQMERLLGKRGVEMTALLIIGRDKYVTSADRLRLEWRRQHAVVGSRQIICRTYDEVARGLRTKLEVRSRVG